VTVERTLWSNGIIKTVEPKSSLTEEGLGIIWSDIPEGLLDIGNGIGEVALVGVTSDHLKASWEGRERRVARVGV
jgi:hypothetical protein